MSGFRSLMLWGTASAVIFTALLFAQSAFGALIAVYDQGIGSPETGTILLIAVAVLVAGFVVTATMFLRSLSTVLAHRIRSQDLAD